MNINEPPRCPPHVSQGIHALPAVLFPCIFEFSGAKELQVQSVVDKSWNQLSSNPKVWNKLAGRLGIPVKNPDEAKNRVIGKSLDKINTFIMVNFLREEGCLADLTSLTQSMPQDEPIKIREWLLNHIKCHLENPKYIKSVLTAISKNRDFDKQQGEFSKVFKILSDEKILSTIDVISAVIPLLNEMESNLIQMNLLLLKIN